MDELLTLQEVAQYLRVTRKTVYRLLEAGHVPAIKVGHQWRFDRLAVDNWLHQRSDQHKCRVLVIDDEEIIGFLFQGALEELGHKVTVATSSPEGLEIAEKNDFDIVFLDLKMPQMDGPAVFRSLRHRKPDLPIVIITGYPDSEMMAQVLAQGPFGVMKKPFGASDITNTVNLFVKMK